jgi:vacuolar-type H+-ATPase subunit I/STV1
MVLTMQLPRLLHRQLEPLQHFEIDNSPESIYGLKVQRIESNMTIQSDLEERTDNSPRNAIEAAKKSRDLLLCFMAQLDEAHSLDRTLKGLFFELAGALTGIEEGRITTGNKQIADSLHALIARWPNPEVDQELFSILGNCMRYGLALQGNPLVSSPMPSIPRSQSR